MRSMSDGAGSLNTDVGGCGFSVLKKTAQLFSKVAAPFYIPTSSIQMIRFSASASAFGVVTIYKFWRECSGFNLHFPDGWRYCFFSWTYLAVYESSLVKCLFMSFAHFLIELFGFSVLRVFMFSTYWSFAGCAVAKYFLLAYLFILSTASLVEQKFKCLMKSVCLLSLL